MAVSNLHTGWRSDASNSRLDVYYKGTRIGHFNVDGITVAAGDAKVTVGNTRLGAISTFGTTEPTSAIVMKVGTNPVGAITTSGAIFCTTGGATLSKIIADGTVSAVQT